MRVGGERWQGTKVQLGALATTPHFFASSSGGMTFAFGPEWLALLAQGSSD